jgi:cytoskeletal protein CcmA (bactofilin family)
VNIGQSICIRGELTGDEDLTIEGRVEGKIDLKEHNLTIGPNGRIQAEVTAKSVRVQGEVNGNVAAGEKVELAETGRVVGDIVAPRIVIADGARFKGSVDMSGAPVSSSKSSSKDKQASVSSAPVITDGASEDSAGAARA